MRGLHIKRLLSVVLCIMMVVALLPMNTLADEAATSTDTQTTENTASSDAGQSSDETGSSEAASTETGSSGDASTSTETTETDPQDATGSESNATGDSDGTTTTEGTETTEEPVVETPAETVSSYTVSFSIGGVVDASMTQTIAANATVDKPSNPSVPEGAEYDGASFLYWYATANVAYNFSTPVTSNFTLYAKFGVVVAAEETTDDTSTDETTDVTTDETTKDSDAALEVGADDELSVLEEGLLFGAMSVDGGILPADTYLWTYTFERDGTTVDSQIIANGDTLYAPEAPAAAAGLKFVGWYDESDTLFTAFGTQSVSDNGATTLSARFETAYYVFFHNQYGSIIETRTPDSSNLVSTSGITSLQLAANEALMGWSTTSDGTSDVGSSVTVNTKNIDLYPIIEQVIWITFDSVGGTYIAPTYINPGVALTQAYIDAYVASQNSNSSTIAKVGYAFSGWSGFSFGTIPTANITLTAGWTAQSVGYTVLFWQQAVTGDDYNFVSSYTVTNRTAIAGSSVSPTSADTGKTDKGFTYNATKSVAVTVNGDGSSILNVYYDRQTWEVRYMVPTKTSSGLDTDNLVSYYTVSGRYGSKLNYWPNSAALNTLFDGNYSSGWGGSTYRDYRFIGWYTGSMYLTYLEKYDDGGYSLFTNGILELEGEFSTSTTGGYEIRHFKQNLDLTWSSSASFVAYAYSNGNFLINNRFEGFTAWNYNTNLNTTWTGATPGSTYVNYANGQTYINIRHTRNSYTLTIRNFNTQLNSTSVLFEKPLTTYQPAQPSRPSGIPTDYVWAGWYTTQAGYAGSEVDWSITMPSNDLIIYGVWKAPSFTGIAHSVSFGSLGGSSVDLGSIAYGGTISAEALAAAQDAAIEDKPNETDIFGGWYILKSGSLILFNSSMRIYENVVLYPVWISGLTYTVTYDLGEADGTAPEDDAAYGTGAQAQVMTYDASLVTAPAGKRFIGWLNSMDSKIYYANSAITVSANTTLTAQWSAAATYIDITYDGNGGLLPGGGTVDIASVLNNTTHTIRNNTFTNTGKLFTGWNTEPDGSGTSYLPEASVLVGASVSTAPSTLYAQWQDQTFTVSVTADPAVGVTSKSGAGPYIYNENATVTWTMTNGYEISSVTDNGITIPAAQYAGNQYILTGVVENHAIVINSVLTLFTLTYNGNGGTYNSSGSYSSIKTIGTGFTVDTNKFAREGYYFLGWSTSVGATAAEPAYAPGTGKIMPAADITLYAVWAEKRPLTLTAASATAAYDGTEQSVSGINSSESGLTIEGTTAGASGTEPGVYPTSFTNQAGLVLKSGGDDVTEQYIVDWQYGNLTINPVVTYISSATGGVIGSESVAYGTGSATYSITPPQNVTVGTTNFYWTGTYSPATATNLTQNTTITAVYSQNKTLVITADSDTRVYNGDTQSVTTATLSDATLTVTGYTVLGSGIDVDTYPVTVSLNALKIMSGGVDVTYQYNVSTIPGVLTINPAKMTATVAGHNAKYDGNAYGISVSPDMLGSTVLYGTTEGDYAFTSSPTATNYTPGMTVYYTVTNPNYETLYGSAQVVINKREIKLTTEDATKVYDTFALTNSAYSLDSDSDAFVEGQGFDTAGGVGTITDVGTESNGFAYTLKDGTLAQNYTISVTEGLLEVTPASGMTVSADSYSTLYDGDGYGVDATASIPGSTIRYSTSYGDDPSDYTLSLSPEQIHAGSQTIYFIATNDNYLPARGSATVTVTPRAITLTAASQTRVYNGSALTNSAVGQGGDGFVGDDGFETTPLAAGSITDVGTTANVVSGYAFNTDTIATDYAVSLVDGSLRVTAATLTVRADAQTIAYPNDRPLNTALTYQLVGGNVAGETPAFSGTLDYSDTLAVDPLEVDIYENAIIGGSLALVNNDAFKAANYTLNVLPANLIVENGTFTVALTGGEWIYDGTAHGPELTGTLPGDTVTYYVSDGHGGWTSTGTTVPTVTNVLDGEVTVKVVVTRDGYDPAESITTIQINPAKMTATVAGHNDKYDGNAYGITVSPDMLGSTVLYGTTEGDYAFTSSPTATNYTPGLTVYYTVTNPNYESIYGSAQVVINKREIKLTTEDATKVYDATALTNAAYSLDSGSDAFVEGQGFATAGGVGTITDVGTENNGFAYTLKEGTLAENYTISVTEGLLEVTPASGMTVAADSYSTLYDGDGYGVDATASIPGSTIRYSTSYGDDPSDYTLNLSPEQIHAGSQTIYFIATNDNYLPARGSATVTVTPRAITLTAASQTRTYNGSALTNSAVGQNGDGFVGDDGFETAPLAAGSITDVGTVANVVSGYEFNTDTIATDYAVSLVDGSLRVNAATLTVRADAQTIAYPNDRPLNTALSYQLVGGNVAGEIPAFSGTLDYSDTLALDPLEVDTYENAIVGGMLALVNNDAFKAANYTLNVLPANLIVENGTFTVALTGGEWIYDGTAHGPELTGTLPGDTVTYYVSDGHGGWTSTGTTVPTVTNVLDGEVTVKVVVTRDGYDPAESTTTIQITPAKMTATVSGHNAKYDGNAYGITVSPDMAGSTVLYGTTEGEYAFTSSPTATNYTPGMTVYYTVTNPNYETLYGSAQVVIGKREIKLTTEDATKVYDTTALTNSAYSLDPGSDAFVGSQGFATAGGVGTITDVGTENNGFAYTLKDGTLAENYTISVTEGLLEVTPASGMTVAASSYSTLYDGDGYGVDATASIPGSTIRYSTSYGDDPSDYTLNLSPEQIHAGSQTIYFIATNDNYLPARGSATVTVTPRAINIFTSSASKVYDGTPLTSTGWSMDVASDGFAGTEGFSLATANGSITAAGTADNGFVYTLKAGTLAADYVIMTTPGKLTVDLRPVLIAADDAQKNYGAADPAFTYHFETGTIGGTTFYDVAPADVGAFTIGVDRTNTTENVGVYADVLEPVASMDASVSANYDLYFATGSFTINPQVTYALDTTDAVTGFPGTQWFGYGDNASIAGDSGVYRPGYHMTGWEDTTTGTKYLLGETIPAIDRNYSLRAIWEITLYNVYYVRGTGDNVDYVPDDVLELKYGTTYVVSSGIPYRSGYSFLYWLSSDVTGTERTFVSGDVISIPDNDVKLTAVWFAEESLVYYHSNFGADERTEGGSFATDAIATVAGNMFSRPGYRFIGWSEASATAGVSRQPGNTFVMPSRQVNFYAQWQQEFYTVTYYVNGGTGTGLDGAAPYATYTNLAYGDAMPKPADPTLAGFTFEGWSTAIPTTVPDGGLVIYGSLSPSTAPSPDVEKIDDSQTPLAGGSAWALLNLILAIASALASLLMLIGYFGKKKQIEDGIVVRETEKHGGVRLTTLLPGIGGIVAFILTENMNNPMIFVDRWTILMVIIAAIQLLLVLLGIKQDKKSDDSPSGGATNA